MDAAKAKLAAERFETIRTALVMSAEAKHAYFASIAWRLNMVADDAVGTACVDGKTMFYSPKFVLECSQAQTVGLYVHELLHVVLKHPLRMTELLDRELANLSADFVVNAMVRDMGFTLPEGAVFAADFDLKEGLSLPEYYKLLQEKKADGKMPERQGGGSGQGGQQGQGQGQGDGQGSPGSGDGQSGDPADGQGHGDPSDFGVGGVKAPQGDAAQLAELEAELEIVAVQAAEAAKSKGKGSIGGALGALIEAAAETTTPWRQVLSEFVDLSAKEDYSWNRPNTRLLSQGLYLPGLRSESIGTIVLGVDESGSIGGGEKALFAEAVEEVVSIYHCEVVVLYHDDRVCHVERWVKEDGPLRLRHIEGGGTSHIPVFEWIERELDAPPRMALFLTDLYTEFPDQAPDYPVLWARTPNGRSEAPFGKVIELV